MTAYAGKMTISTYTGIRLYEYLYVYISIYSAVVTHVIINALCLNMYFSAYE